jgi:ATP-dependent helicase/nuclease subunit B
VALRPRRFSVTDIERLIADPYAIYARRILRLKPLDPLEQETDALDYGTLVHRGIEGFLRAHANQWPADPAPGLRQAMLEALAALAPRPAVFAWWWPRLERIADWVAAEEIRRRAGAVPARLAFEASGTWTFGGPPGAAFTLTAKADRLEMSAGGEVLVLDYKTGKPPEAKELRNGTSPQLPLEAAMAEAGAFAGISGRVTQLVYWHLSGGRQPGAVCVPLDAPEEVAALVAATPARTEALLRRFDDVGHPYAPSPHPGRAPRTTEYAQLSRAGERRAAASEQAE